MNSVTADAEKEDIVVTILRSQVAILRVVKVNVNKESLTMQQFGVLRLLSLRGVLPMSMLSEELKVTPPVITGIVDRLEDKGLVKRSGSASDRRRTDILLIDKGKRVYRKIQADYRLSLQESLRRSLTPAEQKHSLNFLESLPGKFVLGNSEGCSRSLY